MGEIAPTHRLDIELMPAHTYHAYGENELRLAAGKQFEGNSKWG